MECRSSVWSPRTNFSVIDINAAKSTQRVSLAVTRTLVRDIDTRTLTVTKIGRPQV